ncbi:MAG: hypothetical protein JSW27_05045, partial [Phycisphaerales bacterium]
MRVLVYGGGAVGLGVASCLLRSGCDVDIVARRATVEALRASGLVRTGIFGRFHAEPDAFTASTTLAELDSAAYDCVLVCTKSFDSASVARDLAEHSGYADGDARFVLFQNGWGNA